MLAERMNMNITLAGTRFSLKVGRNIAEGKDTWLTSRHCNAEYELHIILRGACSVSIDDKLCRLAQGDALMIAPCKYHFPIMEQGPFEHFVLPFGIHSGPLPELLSRRVPDYLVFRVDAATLDACRRVFEEIREERPFFDEVASALFIQVVAYAFRCLGLTGQAGPEAPDQPGPDWRTSTIDQFFETCFTEYGAKERLAESLHLSKRQLARVLKERYSMSFREKLLSARMDHAGWLLRTTDKKVSEISALVGYSSEGSFFKTFKAYYKVTPQRYRSGPGPAGKLG